MAFTDIFGNSPRVRLLDFLADHVDFDYTVTQMSDSAGISRPTVYRLLEELQADGLILPSREVGDSRLYRLNLESAKVVSMLQADFSLINEDVRKGRFDEKAPSVMARAALRPAGARVLHRTRSFPARTVTKRVSYKLKRSAKGKRGRSSSRR